MKISGFTIIKNAILNDYPIVEAISSILPAVDELVVLIGDSQDNTESLIRSIKDSKIKIYPSVWDAGLRKGGEVLAVETNKAFRLIDPESDWAFYIQGDEVIHEKYLPAILNACTEYCNNDKVQGLLFKYLHFYGTYDYVGDSRRWYNHEVRIIKNNKDISSYKDAQGFRIHGKKLRVKPIEVYVYHYGWVKNPKQMKIKQKNVSGFWHDDVAQQAFLATPDYFDFTDFDSLERFKGTHPAVMLERIAKKNWDLEFDLSLKKFSVKDRFLYWFEKLSGIRPFDFKNYKIIRS
jgi:hypothetical protein